jgi:hypothetical protein
MKEEFNFDGQTEVLLYTKVLRAKNLDAADSNGFSDPFCTVIVGKHLKAKHKTKIKKSTLDPEWNETFSQSVIPMQNVQITIQVHDDDGGIGMLRKVQLLGEATLNLDCTSGNAKLAGGKVMFMRKTLQKAKKSSTVELQFAVCVKEGQHRWDPFFGKETDMQKYAEWNVLQDEPTSTTIPYIKAKLRQIQEDIDKKVLTQEDLASSPLTRLPDECLDGALIAVRLTQEKKDEANREKLKVAAAKEEAARLVEEGRQKELDSARDAREEERQKLLKEKRENVDETNIDSVIDAMEEGDAKKKAKKERFLADIKRNQHSEEGDAVGKKPLSKKAQKMAELERKKKERESEKIAWAADPLAHLVSTKMASIYRMRIVRKRVLAMKAEGTLPAQLAGKGAHAPKKARRKPAAEKKGKKTPKNSKPKKAKAKKAAEKTVDYDAFTFDDPTGTLPEEIVLSLSSTGLVIQDKRSKKEKVNWKWVWVSNVKVHVPSEDSQTDTDSEPADLIHLVVESNVYWFEADDGQIIVNAMNTLKSEAAQWWAQTDTCCYTCKTVDGLEEDPDQPGTFYCGPCWNKW